MPVIRLNSEDNFSILTTAICRAPWGVYRAQFQIKTYDQDLEFTTDNVAHLHIILSALQHLAEDIRDNALRFEQIRSRVSNSTKDLNSRKKLDKSAF